MTKKNNKTLLFGFLILVVIGVGIFLLYNNEKTPGTIINYYYDTATNSYTTVQPVNNPATPIDESKPIPTSALPTDTSDDSGFNFFDIFTSTPEEPVIIQTVKTIIPNKIYSCKDSDANTAVNQYFVAGDVTDQDGTTGLDICQNSDTMIEQLCSNNYPASTVVNCADYGKICVSTNGRGYCKTPVACSDTDNGQLSIVKGTCTDETGSYTDSCLLGSRVSYVNEYYCRNNVCVQTEVKCENSCISGYCGNWV